MNRLVFLDTETTGVDPLVDRLFQVAYKFEDKINSEYFKPPIPISVKSMSISHITNKMVENKKSFKGSKMFFDLEKILKGNILVAHNAMFDIDMLEKEGLKVGDYIDTLKVIRYLDSENIIPEYGLQYLRYFFEFDIEAEAHDAAGDVLVMEKLFMHLFNRMKKDFHYDEKVIEEMINISKKPLLLRIFSYGKHKGRKIEEVLSYDRGYLEWLLEQKLNNESFDEDLIFTLKHHLDID